MVFKREHTVSETRALSVFRWKGVGTATHFGPTGTAVLSDGVPETSRYVENIRW